MYNEKIGYRENNNPQKFKKTKSLKLAPREKKNTFTVEKKEKRNLNRLIFQHRPSNKI